MNLYLDREARYYYIRRWKKLSLPTTDGNNMLDKSWLENLILDEEKIRRVDKCLDMVEEPLSKKNKNFMSDISRLRMRVELGSGVLSELLLVAKKIPESTSMQEFHKEFKMTDGEIVGYHILDKMERLMKDRQDYRENLWCKLKGHTGSTLVFEDLTSKGYQPCGDILFDEERSKFVLRELARYHAMGMALVEGKMVDRKSIRPLFLCEENSKEVFLNSCITSLRDAVANWGPDWSESLKQLKQISDNLERVCQKMAHVNRTTLNVISHGDSWKGNMLFKHDLLGQIPSMKFVDFQILSYCSYIYDLIIFLYSSIDHELRWTKLHDLLQYYRENLIANMKFYNLDSTKVPSLNENILDKFNPGARQMINAGKAYLKALHGAAAASRLYVDAITKLARQSQQGTWGGSSDIGSALMQIVEVYKEIQAQQMNILKAFYVDLLVPLETNLEKDTKVVQSEQKRFLQQHKQRSETYSKAASTIKKQRKKQKNTSKTGIAMDKELKSMQILEEERSKLDAFCEQSLKNAMTQERRRYGFVLERQCSLAKHYLAFHTAGHTLYSNHLDNWQEVAKSREYLPTSVENMFANKLTQVSFWSENGDSPKGIDDDSASLACQLRKTKSVDASCLDMRAMGELPSPQLPSHRTLARAKSDFNLNSSSSSLTHGEAPSPERRPKSMAVPDTNNWDTPLARALYAYLSSGENQLSFLEGDVIALMGERNKGWQFGENLRTQCSGWFPLAYAEPFIDDSATSASSPTHRRSDETGNQNGTGNGGGQFSGSGGGFSSPSGGGGGSGGGSRGMPPPTMRFGDTLAFRNHHSQLQESNVSGVPGFRTGPPSGPPPTVPGVVKSPTALPGNSGPVGKGVRGVAPPPPNASLHSSNDSGFSNDPPPAPEVDYSDDETNRETLMRRRRPRDVDTLRSWVGDDWLDDKHPTLTRATEDREVRLERVQRQLKALELPYEKKVKRTKSLWKIRRGDEVIEGMSMWKHRSLIDLNRQEMQNGGSRGNGESPSHMGINRESHMSKADSEDGLETESCIVVADHKKRLQHSESSVNPGMLPRTRLIRKGGGGGGGGRDREMNGHGMNGVDTLNHHTRNMHHRSSSREMLETPGSRMSHAQPSWYNSWDEIKG